MKLWSHPVLGLQGFKKQYNIFALGLRPRKAIDHHPGLEHSACLDPQSSRRKSRFFLANEGVQLIQFSLFDLGWHGSVRQLGGVLTNPIGNTLWIDLEHSSNRAKAATFHIHANCQQASCFGITVLDWLRCIHSIAFTAAIALAS